MTTEQDLHDREMLLDQQAEVAEILKDYPSEVQCFSCHTWCSVYYGPDGPEFLCLHCGRCAKVKPKKEV